MSFTRVKWLGEADIAVDIDATRALCARIAEENKRVAPIGFGGCNCAECRNLAMSFLEQFPESMKGPLAEIGIDWQQPWEAARFHQDKGRRTIHHLVEYYFVGEAPRHVHVLSPENDGVNVTGDDHRFDRMLETLNSGASAFGHVSIDMCDIPWRMDEPYPEYD